VLSDEKEIKNIWKVYFEKLLNEENERRVFGEGIANERETPGIERSEVRQALKKMKNAKATGPDGIPAEVWKSLGDEGVYLLWDLFRKVYDQEKMPDAWRESVIIPIYKEKGDIQDCGNYRGIKLMSHTMKIWERIIEKRIRNETDWRTSLALCLEEGQLMLSLLSGRCWRNIERSRENYIWSL